MAENLVNGAADNPGQATLFTVNSAVLEASFDTSTDIECEEIEKAKRKTHHNEVEKRRKYKLNDGINKLIEVLPDKDSKRSKTQILEDTYNLIVELKEKCDRLMIQNAPESEVDEIKRLMEENAKLKKENDDFSDFFRSINITDIRTHMKATIQARGKKNVKQEPPSDHLLGGNQNIIIQSPTASVMGSPNLVTMPTNQMTIPMASGNRVGTDGTLVQTSANPGGMLLVTAPKSSNTVQQTSSIALVTNNQVGVMSSAPSAVGERPEAEGQTFTKPFDPVQTSEQQANQVVQGEVKVTQPVGCPRIEASNTAMTCTHEASNQSSTGQVNTTTAESSNTTAVTQVISTPITTPATQNTMVLQTGTSGVRLVQQPSQPQGQTVLIQLPGQPGQYVPIRIAPQVNQPQQVILTSQQGVNVVGTRGSAIQPKTPVKKKQPPQLKVKTLCPLQPDSKKPSSPVASQSSMQPIAPNTVTVRLPVNPTPTANQQGTFVMNNQGQLVMQQPTNTVIAGGMGLQMPVQVVPKPQVTQNIVYIQQNGQLIPVILQQNSGVQQTVQAGTIIQGQQQPLRVQVSQSASTRSLQTTGAISSIETQTTSTVVQTVGSDGMQTSSQSTVTNQMTSNHVEMVEGSSMSTSTSSQMPPISLQGNNIMTPLAIETSSGVIQNESQNLQTAGDFAPNDILAKATESIFANMSDTSPTLQLGDIHRSNEIQNMEGASVADSVIKSADGLFADQHSSKPGLDIYDLPEDMDSSSSKSKHKKKKKKKSKAKEKEKKKKDKDKGKSKSICGVTVTETASSDNIDRESSEVSDMAPEALLESLIGRPLDQGVIDDSNCQTTKPSEGASQATELPTSSNENVQLSTYSTEALLTSSSRGDSVGNQREVTNPVSSATTTATDNNGQALFGSLGSLNFGSDILSSSMSVSGLPTYIDDEGEIVPTTSSVDGPTGISNSKDSAPLTSTITATTTSINDSLNQPSSSMSLQFSSQSSNRVVSTEQRFTPDSKEVSTPTSDGFQNFVSPTGFPSSISSLLEQTSNPPRDTSIPSLPETSQKESPTNGYPGASSAPFQHGWISHHSKASELARGIQQSKSQSPVSTGAFVSSMNSTVTTTCATIMSTTNENLSPTSTSQSTSTVTASKSEQPRFDLLSQPWLSSSESMLESTSQSDTRGSNLRQQQQLADILQDFPGLSEPKVPSSSQSSTDSMAGASDMLNQLSTSGKGQTLESFFNTLNDIRPSPQTSSSGETYQQGINSIVEPSKDKTIQNNRENFLGLPSYPVPTSLSSTSRVEEASSAEEDNSCSPLSSFEHANSSIVASSSVPTASTYSISNRVTSAPTYSLANRITAAPSYSLANRVSALAERQKERSAPRKQQEKVEQSQSLHESLFSAASQPVNRRPESRTETDISNRHFHPKNRALASASLNEQGLLPQTGNPPLSQANSTHQHQRHKHVEPSTQRKSQMPVKTYSTTTIHRTLTADISEEGNRSQEQEEPEPQEVQEVQPVQQEQQVAPPVQHFHVPEAPPQHVQPPTSQNPEPEVLQMKPKTKSAKKKQKTKPQIEAKNPPIPVDDKEDLDGVGRKELDKDLVNKFPWLAESSSGKNGGEDKGSEKQPSSMIQHRSTANPSPFSVQSISQSSSKRPAPKLGGSSICSTGDTSKNPPPYPSRASTAVPDSIWNPSSFDANMSASSSGPTISPKHMARIQKNSLQACMPVNHQNLQQRHEPTSQNRPSASNTSQPPVYEVSSSDSVQQAVQAAVSKAQNQALLSRASGVTSENPDKNRTVSKSKKALQRTEVVTSSQMLSQADIDDSFDFLTSIVTKQPEQPIRSTNRKPQTQDKHSRIESSTPNYLLSGDYESNVNSGVSQEGFSFQQWNLEPTQSEVRDTSRGSSHKIQELSSPPQVQQMQRGGNTSVNLGFGDTSNLGSGDDLDFSSLTSFQPSNQPQRPSSDRQTPQTQTYSVPSGRSSVASMEPSPLQASPMNYNVQESGRISQMSDMPHSNSSSRGPPSVEPPQQQRRVTQSPMTHSHTGQGVKRPANDSHHMNMAKKSNSGVQPGRRSTQQPNIDSRQHSAIHANQQSQVPGNSLQFHSSITQPVSDNSYSSGDAQRSVYTSQGRNHESSRSKKRAPNPSDSIFSRDPHDVDGGRVSLLQENLWPGFGGSQRSAVSSAESSSSTFLPNFSSNSQTPQSQSESTPTSTTSSIISNISPSRRLRHSEMPTYLPHLGGPILPSPPQSKGMSREPDITPPFNTMFTPGRTGSLHGVGMSANFPVFHEHQPPGGFNISKSNQIPGMAPSFNFNNIFNDSSQMPSASHVSDAPPLNHGIGLPPAMHIHGNASIPVEESVLHGNMGQRHSGQPFGNNVMRVDSLLSQSRTPDVRPPFKMGVPPMGMPQHFPGSGFGTMPF